VNTGLTGGRCRKQSKRNSKKSHVTGPGGGISSSAILTRRRMLDRGKGGFSKEGGWFTLGQKSFCFGWEGVLRRDFLREDIQGRGVIEL